MKLLLLKIKALVKLLFFILSERNKIKKAELLFFFPYYHTGGAEKVHLDIVNAVKDKKVYILFTDLSSSEKYKAKFQKLGATYAVYEFLNRNYFVKNTFTAFLVKQINKSPKIQTIFACNSMYFYELLPKLTTKAKIVDLMHAFSKPDYGLEIFSLPLVSKIDVRIVINKKGVDDFSELYATHNLSKYLNRVKIIPIVLNKIEASVLPKKGNEFKVGYVGRWAKEKRPELFLAIAKEVCKQNKEIVFFMAGPNMQEESITASKANVFCKGEITNENELLQFYDNLDVLLITSYREGFPVVIMEAMSKGVIPITTNVGGIPEHIVTNENGFLVNNSMEEKDIVNTFVTFIMYLYEHKKVKETLSNNAHSYALRNFAPNVFDEKYREILLNHKK